MAAVNGFARLACGVFALCSASAFAAGCQSDSNKEYGQLVVVVESDLSVPKDIDRLTFEATSQGRSLLDADDKLGKDARHLPATFQVAYPGNSQAVTLRAVAYFDGEARIQREVVTPIPSNRVGYVRIPLSYLCDGTAKPDGSSTCAKEQTCILGECGSSSLPPEEQSSTPWVTQESSTDPCFDVLSCFDASKVATPDDKCTVAVPDGAKLDRVNVALRLPPDSPGICSATQCWVVLEAGSEGWQAKAGRIQLPAKLCEPGSTAFELAVSTACPQKKPAGTVCEPWSPGAPPTDPGMGGKDPEGMGQACDGDGARACGNCGTQTRSCENGKWSAWSDCDGEADCEPNSAEECADGGSRSCEGNCKWGQCVNKTCEGATTRACGDCGSQSRVCDNGEWSEWSECLGQGECAPDSNETCSSGGVRGCGGDCRWGACFSTECAGPVTRSCGNCGTQTRSCTEGEWSDWSTCQAEGECAPNTNEACGNQGSRSCGGSCRWTECAGQRCEGPTTEACGNCGTRQRVCNNGIWSNWSDCTGAGDCAPNSRQACGNGGTQSCGGNCHWATCTGQRCDGASSEGCGNCGTHTRSCNNGVWSNWSACSSQGACAPNASQACGTNGTQTCTNSCAWGSCGGNTCTGATSRSCGNCGTQTRTCDNSTGTFSAWSTCSDQGVCAPNATQSCGTGGTQTCTSSCGWGNCTGQTCSGPTTQACGNCGNQTRTCNNGMWSNWSTCTGQGACTPSTSRSCGTNGTQNCTTSCAWGDCTGQTCSGPDIQSCGNCGTQTRVCNNGMWSGWSDCGQQGECEPGKTQSCGGGGSQSCNTSCKWGDCLGQICQGSDTQACGNCGSQKRTCNNGTWSGWGDCTGEGVCKPGDETKCPSGAPQRCTDKCEWSSCSGRVVLASGLTNIGPLVVDEKSVYWVSDGAIKKVPLDGGQVTDLLTAQRLPPTSLALDSKYVYFTLNSGVVGRVPLDGGKASSVVSGGSSATGGLVVDPKAVYYFTASNQVVRAPVDGGGTAVELSIGPSSSNIFNIVSDGSTLFWTNRGILAKDGSLQPQSGHVVRIAINGEDRKTLATKLDDPNLLALWKDVLYFQVGGGIAGMSISGGTPKPLFPQAAANGLATDGVALYWTTGSSPGRVMRASVDGGTPSALVTDLGLPAAIAVDGTSVYFATRDAIMKNPK